MNQSPSKTSGLAIWSLVLGILSFVCFSIFSAIPAVICGHKALSRIKRSDGALTGQGLAIGGLVMGYIAIVLSLIIIPVLLAVAIPNFVQARKHAQRQACISNLRAIEGAKAQWAVEHKNVPADVPKEADIFGADKYIESKPICPAGGTYRLNAVSNKPTCSIPGHEL